VTGKTSQPTKTTSPVSSWQRIYGVIRRIPRGKVATYGQVAARAGLPGHARQVGYALAALPTGSAVPWHRVINAQGRLSLERRGPGGGLIQRQRLEKEGIVFDGRRVSLQRFGWKARGGD
jgi:methylated-DNA-protein-cysteine methyltransferase-like protein